MLMLPCCDQQRRSPWADLSSGQVLPILRAVRVRDVEDELLQRLQGRRVMAEHEDRRHELLVLVSRCPMDVASYAAAAFAKTTLDNTTPGELATNSVVSKRPCLLSSPFNRRAIGGVS